MKLERVVMVINRQTKKAECYCVEWRKKSGRLEITQYDDVWELWKRWDGLGERLYARYWEWRLTRDDSLLDKELWYTPGMYTITEEREKR